MTASPQFECCSRGQGLMTAMAMLKLPNVVPVTASIPRTGRDLSERTKHPSVQIEMGEEEQRMNRLVTMFSLI